MGQQDKDLKDIRADLVAKQAKMDRKPKPTEGSVIAQFVDVLGIYNDEQRNRVLRTVQAYFGEPRVTRGTRGMDVSG